jgi:DNA polymerase II small subunit/DNA polymerase delta subunit B
MGREQIVSDFFEKGHLLTEEALRMIEEGTAAPENLPTVVRATDLRVPYRIIKNLTSVKREITREDFVKFYNSKYEKMRDIIVSRVPRDYMSLNKIDSTRSEVHVIGIVRDIREKDGKTVIDLEDKTATVPVIMDDIEDLELDDVAAIRAVAGGKVLFGKKVIYPDMPLRSPTVGTGKACFISDLKINEAPLKEVERFFEWFSGQDIQYLFVAGGIGDKDLFEKYVERYCYMKTVFVISDGDYPSVADKYESSKIVGLSNPAMVEVGGLKILIMRKADTAILRKRYLGKSSAILDEDYLVMEEVPDVVHCGGEGRIINYKSATLLSSGPMLGDFQPVVVDFQTREVSRIRQML